MLNLHLSANSTEHSLGFLQKMLDRMDIGFSKFGKVKTNYSGRYSFTFLDDLCETLYAFLQRWENRRSTSTGAGNAILFALKHIYAYANGNKDRNLLPGNTEILVDAANGLMIEYLSPQVPGAVNQPKTDKQSLGFVGMYTKELETVKDEE